ncbi:MAG: hypothetical protein WAQ53_16100 [Thiofilum sp.]|uniref:hypothetical protein n=1 Tax=Thiofilum sp. TaxID=2212733 RepID=UPI0025ED2E49|nr:hypothetical protein [Thiofilum sp.]MBK8452372.1 hypothetical protein [Thiofilum sp.]
MFSRLFMSYLALFSLSAVGFAPAQAEDMVTTTALQLKQSQQRNRAFLDQLRSTPRLSEAEIAALPKADQAKYRTMRSSLDVLIEQLEALEAENVGLGNSIQAATIKNADLDKKIDALRPAALQSTLNRPAVPNNGVNGTVANPAANPAAMQPRFMNQQPNAAAPTVPATNNLPPMVPSMPPSNTNAN